MRRHFLAAAVGFSLIVLASGCRQTTGPTATTPVSGPTTGTSSVPILGSFGGPTRVTPPTTGSYTVPNNYSGAPTPVSATPSPYTQGNVASPGSNYVGSSVAQPIVNGVQPATYNAPAVPGQPYGSAAPFQTQSPTQPVTQDPRSGGMQPIDMTGAPLPPGYRGTAAPYPPASVQSTAPTLAAPPQTQTIQSFGGSGFNHPIPLPPRNRNVLPQQPVAPLPPASGTTPANSPTNSGSFPASQLATAQPAFDSTAPAATTAQAPPPVSVSTQPTQPAPSGTPSTGGTSSTSLQWRRPGTQF